VVSLADGEDGRLLAHCYGGCDFSSEIEPALIDYGLLDDDDYESLAHSIVPQSDPEDEQRRIANARWLCQIRTDHAHVARYLRARGLSPAIIALVSSVLGYLPESWHRNFTGTPFPAMCAPITNLAGEIVGAHLTFLKSDGSGQAYAKPTNKGEHDRRRQCRGAQLRGGAIRLMPHDPDRELALVEGIEKTLAAIELFGVPGWSVVNAGGFPGVDLPPEQRRILAVVDNDASGCSQNKVREAIPRWQAEGRTVRVWMSPIVGDDASDFLIKRAG
jgi:hypothetical protein